MEKFPFSGRQKDGEYVKGSVVNDVSCWPVVRTMHPDKIDPMEYGVKHGTGRLPRFSDDLPPCLVRMIGDAFEGQDTSRKMIYGFIEEDRFTLIERRQELLEALPNLRPLLNLFPKGELFEIGYQTLKDEIVSLEAKIETHMVGSSGMLADLKRYMSVRKENPEGDAVPVYVRATTRPEGDAPEQECGVRVYESRLLDFLTKLYGQAALVVLDRTTDRPSDVWSSIIWNWLKPPAEHPLGPEMQLGKYNIRERKFERFACQGEDIVP